MPCANSSLLSWLSKIIVSTPVEGVVGVGELLGGGFTFSLAFSRTSEVRLTTL